MSILPFVSVRSLLSTAAVLTTSTVLPLCAQSAGPLQFVPEAELTGSGTLQFARSLSLSGDDVVARSVGDSASLPARAFVFHRAAGAWSEQAAFTIPYGNTLTCTSRSTDVAISGDRVVIGQPSFGPLGKAWISERAAGVWSPVALIEDETQNNFRFGQAVLLYGALVVVGVPDGDFPGSFWIWRKHMNGWDLQERIFPFAVQGHADFGAMLASSGTTLLVSESDTVVVMTQGATPLQWSLQAVLDPPSTGLVSSISIDGDRAAISMVGPGSCSPSGVAGVHVFERSGTTWDAGTLVANGHATAVALRGDTLYAGFGSSNVVRVYQKLGASWAQTAEIEPVSPTAIGFGTSLACDGATLCVGAPGGSSLPGSAEVFDVEALPAASTYCVAKTNSQGCLPAIAASGVAGLTSPTPFVVGATNVINQKTGLLIYSTAGPASTPFQGGTLCLAAPLHRTPAQSSGGSVGADDCTGAYSFDFNVWAQSAIDPGLVPGVQVWAQYYSRDPADTFQVGLTDAVTFVLGS